MRAVFRVVVVLGLLVTALQAQRGALVMPRSLDELTSQADRIVEAHVVSAKVEPDPDHPKLTTLLVRLRVADTLKGAPAKEITFRQFIWDFRDKRDAAGYQKGQQLVLFLNKKTSMGLTSPTGLDQGRLIVSTGLGGEEVVHPKVPNARFLKGLSVRLQSKGRRMPASLAAAQTDPNRPIALSELKQTVRELVQMRTQK